MATFSEPHEQTPFSLTPHNSPNISKSHKSFFMLHYKRNGNLHTNTHTGAAQRTGPHQTYTPQKEMDPVGSLLIPPTRREGELEVRSLLGPSRLMQPLMIRLGGTRTCNSMLLQTPGRRVASVINGTPSTGARHVCASERPMVEGSQGGCCRCW